MRQRGWQTLYAVGFLLTLGTLHLALASREPQRTAGAGSALQGVRISALRQQQLGRPAHTQQLDGSVEREAGRSWGQAAWAWLARIFLNTPFTRSHGMQQQWQPHQQQQQQHKQQQPHQQQHMQQQHAQQQQDGTVPRQDRGPHDLEREPDWPWYPWLDGEEEEEGQQAGQQQDTLQSGGRRLLGGRAMPHEWPGFLLPERERHLGLAYPGDWGRLRAALSRHKATGNLTVGVVGGSISAGAGALNSHSWVEWLEDWLGLQYNGSRDAWIYQPAVGDPRVRVANGAVPGTFSSYMSVCYSKHVPQDVDIVIVEYALNDEAVISKDKYDNLVRRAFERLLRKLLTYPKQPAVILLNAYAWFQADHQTRYDGMFYTGADADFFEFAAYYQIPMLSVKTASYRLMQQAVTGFQVKRVRGSKIGAQEPEELDNKLKDTTFYWDHVHPNGETGHRVMADLVVQLLTHADKSLLRRPWSDAEAKKVSDRGQLPNPMIRDNWESKSDKCFVGDTLHSQVLPHPPDDPYPSFQWVNDQPEGKKAKWGYVANETGAFMEFKVDTRTASYRRPSTGTPAGQGPPMGQVAVELAYLRSYEGMGQAEVTCAKNCYCVPKRLDGLFLERKVSLVALFEIRTTMHEECVIRVTALGTTSSVTENKGTKVKITGVMISDEGSEVHDEGKDLKSFTALDFVQDGLRPNQSFEIQYTYVKK